MWTQKYTQKWSEQPVVGFIINSFFEDFLKLHAFNSSYTLDLAWYIVWILHLELL